MRNSRFIADIFFKHFALLCFLTIAILSQTYFFLLYTASDTEQLKILYTDWQHHNNDLITNIFLKTLFNAKSNDLICD